MNSAPDEPALEEPGLDLARLARLLELFGEAMELGPDARAELVTSATAGDETLRAELEAMLVADEPESELELERELGEARAGELTRGELEAGAMFGVYRVLRPLGRGGMGEVYLAERADGAFEHLVAIKLLRAGLYGDEAIRRFERERSILARLSHSAVAPLLDGGVANDGRPYLVLQYVDGEPITSWADHHQLSVERRLRLFLQVARAVEYAHTRLVIHRDLKPSNILVTAEGDPRLLDFGIAKLLGDDDEQTPELTRQGAAPLTPERAAPEQLRGEPPATATDVWALGVLLYELLVGQLPFSPTTTRPTSPVDQLAVISARDAERPSRALARDSEGAQRARSRSSSVQRLRRTLRGELDTIVGKALQPNLERRYAGAGALANDIEAHLAGRPISARTDTLGYRLRRLAARHPIATAASVIAVVVLVVLTIVATLGQREARLAEARAVAAAARAQTEHETATEATEFLVDLFRAADPRRNPGLELTARELLERGVERLDELEQQPAVQAQLLTALGDVYWMLGVPDRAEELLRRSLVLRTSGAAPAVLEQVSTNSRLAGLLRDRSEYVEAEALYREALELLEMDGKLGTPQEVTVLNNLGIVLNHTQQLDEADVVYRRAIALMEEHQRTDPAAHEGWSSNIANLWVNLGSVANSRGRFPEAELATSKALALLQDQLPENHPNLAVLHNNLGHFAAAQGELGRALEFAGSATAINDVALPADHPRAAAHRLNRGRFLVRVGRFDEARAELEAAASVFEAKLGATSYDITRPLGWIGVAAYAGGDLDAAANSTQAAIDIVREEANHPSADRDLPVLLRRLAVIEMDRGAVGASRLAAEEALALSRAADRPEDLAVATLVRALVALREGDEDGAHRWWTEAERHAAKSTTPANPLDCAEDLVLRASWWSATGDHTRAFSSLDSALDHPGWTSWMLESPHLEPLHSDPRWAGIVERLRDIITRRGQSASSAS